MVKYLILRKVAGILYMNRLIPKIIKIRNHRVKITYIKKLRDCRGFFDIGKQEIQLWRDNEILETLLHEIIEYIACLHRASRKLDPYNKNVYIILGHNPSDMNGDQFGIFVEDLYDTIRRNKLWWIFEGGKI